MAVYRYYLVSARTSVSRVTDESLQGDAIAAIWRQIPMIVNYANRAQTPGVRVPDCGDFVGLPEVVRENGILSQTVNVRWLYRAPDDCPYDVPAALREGLALALTRADPDGGWTEVSVTPHNPLVQGSVEAWQSGQIANNANNAPRSPNPLDNLPGLLSSYADVLKVVVVGGVLGAGLYFAWPYLSALRGAGERRSAEARANPTRRRRRRQLPASRR